MNSTKTEHRWQVIKLAFVLVLACGACLALTLLTVNLSPRLLIVALGLEHAGPLERVFPPEADSLTLAGEVQGSVEVTLPDVAEPLTVLPDEHGASVIGDASTPGKTVYLLTVDEAGLNQFVSREILPNRTGGDRYRDLTIDLQPGGLVLYADVDLGLRRQRMGLVLLHQEESQTLSPAGVVLDGELYELPEGTSPARALLPVGRQTRRALWGLTIVGPLPGEAHVQAVQFHPDRLQVLAQATFPAPVPADTGWQSLEPGVERREIDVAAGSGNLVERLRVVRLDPAAGDFRVRYAPDEPKTISAWAAEGEPLLVVNGGYFTPEDEGGEAIGLLVSDGQLHGRSLGPYAGMFAVTPAGGVSVRWLASSPYDAEEPLAQAVQAFPVLVKPGGVMGFPAEADEGVPARRTVVAQDRAGRILFIVAPRGHLSLHELAVFLTESDLSLDVALNLDGGGSTGIWLSASDATIQVDSFTRVPSVITVQRR